jgi:uncharacterized protein (DUF1800 family)
MPFLNFYLNSYFYPMNSVSRSVFLDIVTGKRKDETTTAQQNATTAATGIKPYTGPWGKEQILHLLRRSLFGVTVDDYAFFSKLGLSQALDVLLTSSPTPAPPVNTYQHQHADPDVPFGETWVNCTSPNIHEIDVARSYSLQAWWIGQMINQDRSLTEKMTLFWHNHMAASFNCINDTRNSYFYLTALRAQALGNFKQLSYDVTVSTGMLQYLGGYLSQAIAPNENYSREFQELFTVGKGPDSHYTQADVVAAARILTGWTNDKNGVGTIFKDEWHDTRDKQFSAFYNNTLIKGRSGAQGAEETRELIDMIFNQHEVAMHTCRCLYRWFVSGPIDKITEENVIVPLAGIFIQNKYEIVPVLRALLGSEHFFDAANTGSQCKNPVDFLIGLSRQLNLCSFPGDITAQYTVWKTIALKLDYLGMRPGYPPNVAGWPAYYQQPGYSELWLNSDTLVKRNVLTDALVATWGLIYDPQGPVLRFDVLGFTSRLSDPSDMDKLITESTALLCGAPVDMEQRAFLKVLLLYWPEYEHKWTASLHSQVSKWMSDEHSWRNAWLAYKDEPGNSSAKTKVVNRLTLYYSYLLQQAECQLM